MSHTCSSSFFSQHPATWYAFSQHPRCFSEQHSGSPSAPSFSHSALLQESRLAPLLLIPPSQPCSSAHPLLSGGGQAGPPLLLEEGVGAQRGAEDEKLEHQGASDRVRESLADLPCLQNCLSSMAKEVYEFYDRKIFTPWIFEPEGVVKFSWRYGSSAASIVLRTVSE